MFRRVMIANRGEIAVRIIRTLREMGITSIAAFSDADREALFVREADEAYRLGPTPPGESYLNVDALLSVARQAHADAVHPGYGFLAENAGFARAVEDAGLAFIGPSAESIRLMGDKVVARRAVAELGVPVVPGTPEPLDSLSEALEFAERAGYPVAVKAAGGGGGRGIRVVERPDGMAESLEAARREAQAYFANPEVYLERYFPDPRHVEFQVLGDRHGHLVHLGERDCSVQRRHQKLIEETPSPAVNEDLRGRMGEAALRAATAARYSNAGTVEFLLTREGEYFFLEMNTRIQVEHPITEEVTGVDLVREMVLAAAGEPITVRHDVLRPNGHAIEVRVNAEDPTRGFRPSPASIGRYREPGGIGVRMDSGVYQGFTIPGAYDSLLSKVVARAPDRERARLRQLRALDEYEIVGPSTTIPFARAVLSHPIFVAGEAGTTFVGSHMAELMEAFQSAEVEPAGEEGATRGPERIFQVEVNRKLFQVKVAELEQRREVRPRRSARTSSGMSQNALVSPMHGTVIAIKKRAGEAVELGETLLVIEAMKMENEVQAQRSGTVKSIDVVAGETVEADQRLAVIE